MNMQISSISNSLGMVQMSELMQVISVFLFVSLFSQDLRVSIASFSSPNVLNLE